MAAEAGCAAVAVSAYRDFRWSNGAAVQLKPHHGVHIGVLRNVHGNCGVIQSGMADQYAAVARAEAMGFADAGFEVDCAACRKIQRTAGGEYAVGRVTAAAGIIAGMAVVTGAASAGTIAAAVVAGIASAAVVAAVAASAGAIAAIFACTAGIAPASAVEINDLRVGSAPAPGT